MNNSPINRSTQSWGYGWLWLALALHAGMALGSLFFPPMMNSDSATGFLIWDSWVQGAPWNHLTSADPADISRSISFFHGWWSPGQYLIVAPWQLLGLSLGQSIAWGGFLATASALIGFWRLFLSWGFSTRIAGLSVLGLACNWTLTRTYGDYMGGETALFAVLPWLILLTSRLLERGRWIDWALLPLIYWLGSVAKNTFTPIFAGLVIGIRTAILWPMRSRATAALGEIARWIAVIGLGHALFWATFLRFGTSPAAALGGPLNSDWPFSLLRLIGFPLGSLFSTGTILGRIFQHPAHPLVDRIQDLWPAFAVLAVGGVALMSWIIKQEFTQRPRYAAILSGNLLASLGFYGLVALWRDTGGMDERFFKPVGFLFLPGLIAALATAQRRWLTRMLGIIFIGTCGYGLAAYANRAIHIHNLKNVGRRDTTQHVLSPQGLRLLRELDASLPASSLIVVPSPEMALELWRTRVLATDAALRGADAIRNWRHHGRVNCLVVFSNAAMENSGQRDALLSTFDSYRPTEWRQHKLDDWTISWVGGPIGLP